MGTHGATIATSLSTYIEQASKLPSVHLSLFQAKLQAKCK